MDKKYKLLFLIPSLEIGGSQKVLSIILQNISEVQFDCTLCVLTSTGEFYDQIPDYVKKVNLKVSRVRYAAFPLYRFIRNSKPDLVFIFDVNHLNLIVGGLSLFLSRRIKYVSRQAVVLNVFLKSYGSFGLLRKWLYILTFKRIDLIVAQSENMKSDLVKFFYLNNDKIRVINNPVMVKEIADKSRCEKKLFSDDKINILAVGRMVFVKGYDLLIKALTLVEDERVHLTLIGGETPEDQGLGQWLKDYVSQNHLDDKVTFLGFISNPYQYISQCSAVVITSRAEAFPNIAIEANALGKPVLAFNCPGGISEIIVDGVNGWLIENGNIEAFAKAIDNIKYSRLLPSEIIRNSEEKFEAAKVVKYYQEVVLNELEMGINN